MKLIETPWANIALWKMAETLPDMLLRQAMNEPKELLESIEMQVEGALEMRDYLIQHGTDKQQAKEYMMEALNPSWTPEIVSETIVTEEKMEAIKLILLKEAKKKEAQDSGKLNKGKSCAPLKQDANMKNVDFEEPFSVKQVCELLGRTQQTLIRWKHLGYLTPYYVGRTPYYRREDVLKIKYQ